jgi:probable rRNA maturation factor
MRIAFDEDHRPDGGLTAFFERAAALALRRDGIDPEGFEISFCFASRDEIRALNRQCRNKDAPTDVLSFPMHEGLEEIRAEAEGAGAIMLGDVVICGEIAERQAAAYGHSLTRELVYLFVHSVLHLLGYAHEEADGEEDTEEAGRRAMREAEEAIMKELGLERGAI